MMGHLVPGSYTDACCCIPLLLLLTGYCTHQSTLAELANRTVDPSYTRPIRREPPTPAVPLPEVSEPGSCNKYIPPETGGRTMDRFLWTIQWLVANGMYVLIDYHPMVSEGTAN